MTFGGEKTEQPTPRRLEEALKKGQFPRSAEVQTVSVLLGAMMAMLLAGPEIWRQFVLTFAGTLGHLHEFSMTHDAMQGLAIKAFLTVGSCVWPILLAALVAGLLAGGMQSRFQTASEALSADWSRVNPISGLKRLFSFRSGTATLISLLKISVIFALSYGRIKSILNDPIFSSTVSIDRIATFLGASAFSIVLHVSIALIVIAAI